MKTDGCLYLSYIRNPAHGNAFLRSDTCMHMGQHYTSSTLQETNHICQPWFTTMQTHCIKHATLRNRNTQIEVCTRSMISDSAVATRKADSIIRFDLLVPITGPYAVLTNNSVTDLTSGRPPESFPFGIVYGKS